MNRLTRGSPRLDSLNPFSLSMAMKDRVGDKEKSIKEKQQITHHSETSRSHIKYASIADSLSLLRRQSVMGGKVMLRFK